MNKTLTREELAAEIRQEGQYEEFYMPNHPNLHFRGRFTGNNAYMFDYHKQRRLKLEAEYRRLYG